MRVRLNRRAVFLARFRLFPNPRRARATPQPANATERLDARRRLSVRREGERHSTTPPHTSRPCCRYWCTYARDWNISRDVVVRESQSCAGGGRAREAVVRGRRSCEGGGRAREAVVQGRRSCERGGRAREAARGRASRADRPPRVARRATDPPRASPTHTRINRGARQGWWGSRTNTTPSDQTWRREDEQGVCAALRARARARERERERERRSEERV